MSARLSVVHLAVSALESVSELEYKAIVRCRLYSVQRGGRTRKKELCEQGLITRGPNTFQSDFFSFGIRYSCIGVFVLAITVTQTTNVATRVECVILLTGKDLETIFTI